MSRFVHVRSTGEIFLNVIPNLSLNVQNEGKSIKYYEEYFDFETKRGRMDMMAEALPSEVKRVTSFYNSESRKVVEIISKDKREEKQTFNLMIFFQTTGRKHHAKWKH